MMLPMKKKLKEYILTLWNDLTGALREGLGFLWHGVPELVRFIGKQLLNHKCRSLLPLSAWTLLTYALGGAALLTKGLGYEASVYLVVAAWMVPLALGGGVLVCVFGAEQHLWKIVQALIATGIALQIALDTSHAAALIRQSYIAACCGVVGAMAYYYLTRLDPTAMVTLLNALSMLFYALLLLSPASHGTKAWLSVRGTSFQLTEVSKLLAIIAISRAATEPGKTDRVRTENAFKIIFLHALGLAAVNELGTAVVVLLCACLILFITVRQLRWTAGWCALTALAAYGGLLACKFCAELGGPGPLRLGMLVYNKALNRLGGAGDNFQRDAADKALLLSGWFGTDSRVTVPAGQTDFALVSLVQIFGVSSAIFVMFLFGFLLFWVVLLVSRQETPTFPATLAFSCVLLVEVQALLNVISSLGMGPIMGVGMPFLSLGGSNLAVISICLGTALAASSELEAVEGLPFKV